MADSLVEISKLSDDAVNKIAAGEVVERPSSVVKELVENAIDAGATKVDVYLEEGGRRTIRVVDNGGGIPKDQLDHAVTRHFTSKISTIDDLSNIHSYGFRGEALASIASVSDFSIASRVKGEDEGWKLVISDGSEDLIPHGMPVGTEVSVQNLFKHIPARQKFLKQDSTEASHVLLYLQQIALVTPSVAISLHKDGKKTFSTVGSSSSIDLLAAVVGKELAERMVPVDLEEPHIKVSGWVGEAGTGISSRPKQYIFVNKRPVDHRSIYAAVQQGYASIIGRHEKPQFVIMVEVPPHIVDVNVHPQKREVRFIEESFIFQKVKQAVGLAVMGQRSESRVVSDDFSGATSKDTISQMSHQPFIDQRGAIDSSLSFGRKDSFIPSFGQNKSRGYGFSDQQSKHIQDSVKGLTPIESSIETFPTYQLMNLFIVEDHGEFIEVFDQHAVHERVLYEQFSQQYISKKSTIKAQPLLTPREISLEQVEDGVKRELCNSLRSIGFVFDEKDEVFYVTAIPVSFVSISLERFISEVAHDLLVSTEVGVSEVKEIDNQTHRRLAIMSCRGAIKSGDPLSEFEVRELIKQFHATQNNMTCPHGRPVRFRLEKEEMMKWFKR
ncbi:hypothetical protein CO179_01010 [candidate division WWE3 bacterium CG_4_9_14_3_um_filter_39_7]|uniref:DNA mismatch repair protein MutL n=1 Tax=candidate division WWE3 bacterium CG_4_9_14_3_um_filter_39_7 TaxID=1975080 RepID=A0A2M7X427_UNCKA|nr:MAG: hypothetical protein CO179_01010 [candidate division WWE3 bacterium CG_4_9_14_3_um_filter_39_7]